MKYILSFVIIVLFIDSIAQVPQAIPYQAVARDNAGNLLAGQNISVRVTIRNATAMGIILYSETHLPLTNDLGLFKINIGEGSVVTGSFTGIAWSTSTGDYK